jgi:hypothetical protein
MAIQDITPQHSSSIELDISSTGRALGHSVSSVLDAVGREGHGPAELARTLGIDKVLASRALKASRNRDPMAVVFLSPGPDPLRRVIKAAARRGVEERLIDQAERAIHQFDCLIKQHAGDRSALDAIISSWLPQARAEFELRRKQSAFKAMSQLKGAVADVNLATVVLHPSDDGEHLDVVWVTGLLGLHRLRPGAAVKFATRRLDGGDQPRRPVSLDGQSVDGLHGVRLDAYCSSPAPELDVVRAGEVVHYTLAGDAFGPRSAVDLVFAEVNRNEMKRYVAPGSARKGYVFAEISTPTRTLHFDVLVHSDVYRGGGADTAAIEPQLLIYDTALDGVANINDPSRDIDRMDMLESIQSLGIGPSRWRSADVPNYAELIREVCTRLGWDAESFRGYRCRIDYPIYGSQVAMAFDPPERPESLR